MLTNLTGRDECAILVRIRIGGQIRKVCFASIYLPSDGVRHPSEGFCNIVEWCSNRNIELVVGCDSNSHHTVWGSRDNNNRGDALAEYLVSSDLSVINRGGEPTFVAMQRQSMIDITLVSRGILDSVEGWQVSDEPSLSDHRYIHFSIKSEPQPPGVFRNPKSTDWDQYRGSLASMIDGGRGGHFTVDDIEREVTAFNTAVISSYHTACPVRRVRRFRKVPWWDRELATLRRDSRRLFRRAQASGAQDAWNDYRDCLRQYKRDIKNKKTMAWRKFCSEVESTPEASRMRKLLNRDHTAQVGVLKLPNGSYTEDGRSTIEHLLSVHFPDSVVVSTEADLPVLPPWAPTRADWEVVQRIITPARVCWAVRAFKPFKAAGEDGIFPALLQHGLEVLGPSLHRILSSCLARGYIPQAWRDIKVVFIPKPGKASYALAKSHRPISISSFVLKTLEKLVDRYIREDALVNHPLSTNQHAYIAGRSTETALHKLVSRIERSFYKKEYALAVFLDIEGAFDNAAFDVIEDTLRERGVHSVAARWIGNLLRCRIVHGSVGDSTVRVAVKKGTPQGGVLSPLLWDLVVDSLLRRLEGRGIYVQFYSDDGVLLVSGLYLDVVCSIMQQALATVQQWCEEQGLSVNPQKTEMVLFTHKRKIQDFRAPRLYGAQLQLTSKAKYLGVVLDSKLLWNCHVEQKCKKAIAAFWQCRRAVGRTWGLSPRITHWIYTAVIRPMIVYGAVVWWVRGALVTVRGQLGRVQRMACLGITGAMRSTPTAALEALLGIVPLHIFVMQEALSACYRLCRTGQWVGAIWPGHGSIRDRMVWQIPLLGLPSDSTVRRFRFTRRFQVSIPHREAWDDESFEAYIPGAMLGFTDGSRSEDCSGAGVYIPEYMFKQHAPLGKYATVFQAEVWAICFCAQELALRGCVNRQVYICSDSASALQALSSYSFSSKLVLGCFDALQHLAGTNQVTLLWVPGHSGHMGNEVADGLAKKGSDTPFCGPEPAFGISPQVARSAILKWSHRIHCSEWGLVAGCRQSKEFLDGPSLSLSRILLDLPRARLRQYVAVITGHNTLNYHLWRMGVLDDSLCLVCGMDEESSYHFLCECPAFVWLRYSVFGRDALTYGDIKRASVKDVLAFAKRSRRLD
ncbi:MAG: hypothetical protein GY696_31350 [Gammaproteobacteria bacterium]|nr:hypothetical protein [Gammaproteobacteria bacterium]